MVTSAAVGGTLQYGYNLAITNAPTVVSTYLFYSYLCLLMIILLFFMIVFNSELDNVRLFLFTVTHTAVYSLSLQYIQNFVNETVHKRWGITLDVYQVTLIWTIIVSVFSLGGLTGALLAGPMSIHFGRYNFCCKILVYLYICVTCTVSIFLHCFLQYALALFILPTLLYVVLLRTPILLSQIPNTCKCTWFIK